MFNDYLAVMFGGALGAVIRYLITSTIDTKRFPYGTWLVNVLGSFLGGIILGIGLTNDWETFIVVGILGALTTFSSVQLHLLFLWQEKKWSMLILYSMSTYVCCLAFTFIGFYITSF